MVPIGGARPAALVRALALAPDRRLSIGHLVKEVWPEGPPKSATRSLAAHVSRVRSAFAAGVGRPLIERDADHYALRLTAGDRIDADDLEKWLIAAGTSNAPDRPAHGLDDLDSPANGPAGPVVTAALERLRSRAREVRLERVQRMAVDPSTDRGTLLAEVRGLLRDVPEHGWLWELVLGALESRGDAAEAGVVRALLTRAAPSPPATGLAPIASGGRIVPPLTRFIGRADDVRRLTAALEGSRLVTVTGPAGAGKTRLAIEVARRDPWGANALLVKLAGFDGPDLDAAILSVFSAPGSIGITSPRALRRSAADRLADVGLLLLDTGEHLVGRLGPYCADLLGRHPHLTVLITSRRRIGVHGETLVRVNPLDLPPADADEAALRRNDAVTLFLDRATRRRATVADDVDALRAIARIVRRLDGVPLAIELVAAGALALSPQQIDQRLAGGPVEDLPLDAGVHTSMAGALQWSYDLLDDHEQALFRRLSVFGGSFTLDGATAVDDGDDTQRTLAVLSRLVDHSLVDAEPSGDGALRYRLLDTMADFASRRLDGDELAIANEALLDHYTPIAAMLSAKINTPEGTGLAARMHLELNTVERVLAWATRNGRTFKASHLIAASSRFWALSGLASRGNHWMREAVASSADLSDTEQVQLLVNLMLIDYIQGNYAATEEAAARVLPVAARLGTQYPIAAVNLCRGAVAVAEGRPAEAATLLTEAHRVVALPDAAADPRAPWLGGLIHCMQVLVARDTGDPERGRRHAREARQIFEAMGDGWGKGFASWALGALERAAGRPVQAVVAFAEPTQELLERRELMGIAFHLSGAAGCALELGKRQLACQLFGAAEAGWEAAGTDPMPIMAAQYRADLAQLERDVPEWDRTRWMAEGHDLPVRGAVALIEHLGERVGAA